MAGAPARFEPGSPCVPLPPEPRPPLPDGPRRPAAPLADRGRLLTSPGQQRGILCRGPAAADGDPRGRQPAADPERAAVRDVDHVADGGPAGPAVLVQGVAGR